MDSELTQLKRGYWKRYHENLELKKKIKYLEIDLYWENFTLENHKTYAYHKGHITNINYKNKFGYIYPNIYFNYQTTDIPFYKLQKDKVVIYRTVNYQNKKFYCQAYIHYVCESHEQNEHRIQEDLIMPNIENPQDLFDPSIISEELIEINESGNHFDEPLTVDNIVEHIKSLLD
jgi:hypothetical protein